MLISFGHLYVGTAVHLMVVHNQASGQTFDRLLLFISVSLNRFGEGICSRCQCSTHASSYSHGYCYCLPFLLSDRQRSSMEVCLCRVSILSRRCLATETKDDSESSTVGSTTNDADLDLEELHIAYQFCTHLPAMVKQGLAKADDSTQQLCRQILRYLRPLFQHEN